MDNMRQRAMIDRLLAAYDLGAKHKREGKEPTTLADKDENECYQMGHFFGRGLEPPPDDEPEAPATIMPKPKPNPPVDAVAKEMAYG